MSGRPGEMTLRAAAKKLDRSVATLRRWCKQKRIPYRVEVRAPQRDGKVLPCRYWIPIEVVGRLHLEFMHEDRTHATYRTDDTRDGATYCSELGCQNLAAPRHPLCSMHIKRRQRGVDMHAPKREVLHGREKFIAACLEVAEFDAEADEKAFDLVVDKAHRAARTM